MTSNSDKMTLEQRLVQKLKDDTLMSLVGDEDAITDLVTRAIQQSLFEKRVVRGSYGSYSLQETSPVMLAAEKHADKLAEKVGEELLEDVKTKKAIRDLMIDLLPQALGKVLDSKVQDLLNTAAMQTIQQVRDLKGGHL